MHLKNCKACEEGHKNISIKALIKTIYPKKIFTKGPSPLEFKLCCLTSEADITRCLSLSLQLAIIRFKITSISILTEISKNKYLFNALKISRRYFCWYICVQEAMESFAFPEKNYSISTEIPQRGSKLFFLLLESFEYSLYILDWYAKGHIWIKKPSYIKDPW